MSFRIIEVACLGIHFGWSSKKEYKNKFKKELFFS
jgi:hypothetical protein